MVGAEKRNITKSKIVNYIINHEATSKVELSKDLNLSMPTVLSNVNELLANGIAVETGEYESTGGRKAKRISINPAYRYAVGIRITAKHAGFVLVNLSYEIEKYERIRLEFSTEAAYYLQLSEALERFLSDVEHRERILGIGISIPGIVNSKERMLIKSHALQLENYSLSFLEQIFSLPVYFENDANAAMMAEDLNNYRNALYLSLNNTLGGAFCIDGKLIPGANQKAGEFGHMILVPGGKKCYCGKQGCADAYCAASVLTDDTKETLEQFMKKVEEQDGQAVKVWKEYLNNLAILISNLRMAYDMDIILGGEVGGYLDDHMITLWKKLIEYIDSKEQEIEQLEKLLKDLDRSIEHVNFLNKFDEPKKDFDSSEENIKSRIQIHTKKIIGLICREILVDPEEAEQEFKKSNTYLELCDMTSGLWSENVDTIFQKYLIEKRRHLLETVRQSKEFLELANANTEKSLTLLKEENIDIMGENTRSKK